MALGLFLVAESFTTTSAFEGFHKCGASTCFVFSHKFSIINHLFGIFRIYGKPHFNQWRFLRQVPPTSVPTFGAQVFSGSSISALKNGWFTAQNDGFYGDNPEMLRPTDDQTVLVDLWLPYFHLKS